jgi:hypothetical protein
MIIKNIFFIKNIKRNQFLGAKKKKIKIVIIDKYINLYYIKLLRKLII